MGFEGHGVALERLEWTSNQENDRGADGSTPATDEARAGSGRARARTARSFAPCTCSAPVAIRPVSLTCTES